MAQRVTLRKRQPYNTTSSRRRIVKTPGGVLRYHHIKKLPTAPKCGDCGSKLSGVRSRFTYLFVCIDGFSPLQVVALRPRQYATVSKTKKHVTRAYGGSRCGGCVRSRYVISPNFRFRVLPLIIYRKHRSCILDRGSEGSQARHQVTANRGRWSLVVLRSFSTCHAVI
jgi:large subunit ribosomal protein L34e